MCRKLIKRPVVPIRFQVIRSVRGRNTVGDSRFGSLDPRRNSVSIGAKAIVLLLTGVIVFDQFKDSLDCAYCGIIVCVQGILDWVGSCSIGVYGVFLNFVR